MRILIGTTNPSKVRRFSRLLAGSGAELLTPAQLHIAEEPAETGATPLENARIKALFYSRFCERVIANDSGLYIAELAADDPRQPGMRVRSPRGVRLDDEEMIAYYAALARSLGGRMTAYYLDGVAVYSAGRVQGFIEEDSARKSCFYMVDAPHAKRHPGWPLDSLSQHCDSGRYFVEQARMTGEQDDVFKSAYWQRLREFLWDALGVEER